MAYCVPLGIPYSIFGGRPHPNPDDPYEPLWLPDDVALALSFRFHEATRCPRCSIRDQDWPTDERLEDETYVVDSRRCPGCAMLERHRRMLGDEKASDGTTFRLVPYDEDQLVLEAEAMHEREVQWANRPDPEPPRPIVRGMLES